MSQPSAVVYTPDSPLRHPFRLLGDMLRDLAASRELAWRLFVRDISAQYRQSALGYVWAFAPPLVAGLPFIFLNSQGIVSMGQTRIPYAAYAMIGTVTWQVFVDAINSPLRTVTAAKTMLTRINFPREAVLLSGFGQVIFNFLIRLILLGGVLVATKLAPAPTAWLFPVGVLALILVGFAIGVLLTPLGMLYGDIQQVIPVATTFLMLLTPVLYPMPKVGLAARVAQRNPLTPLVIATRDWLTVGVTDQSRGFAIVTAGALVLLMTGWILYRLALPHLIARSGN
jgi:lipopolysaccharide transport system permease protein